ncbi:hypothetical protein AB9F37_33115, partial [Rhizobium leguminosarum]
RSRKARPFPTKCWKRPTNSSPTAPGDEFVADCARLIDTYHDTSPFSMRQVVVAPCQPVNCYRETFLESVALARDRGVMMHTHVGEGESPVIQAR